jgi:hypothetical protein
MSLTLKQYIEKIQNGERPSEIIKQYIEKAKSDKFNAYVRLNENPEEILKNE